MANKPFSGLTELAEPPAIDDFMAWTDKSDTTDSANGTSKRNKAQYALGSQVNAQTGTSYTYLTTDFRKLVTHTNGSAIAGTLPQAGASFPAGWFMFVQNRGAGALTITPTTSTIDGSATLVLNQNEGALIVSDGTNYFSMRGKATGGVGGVGDVVGPGSATDNAIARYDSTTGKLIQNSVVIVSDAGAITVPEIAAPSTPAAGTVHIYAKSDGHVYAKDDAGTETDLTGGGSVDIAPLQLTDANTVEQYNSTNAQRFAVYGTRTDASNYSRLRIGQGVLSGTNFDIVTEGAGTGSAAPISFQSNGGFRMLYNNGSLHPTDNGAQILGGATTRWSDVRSVQYMAQNYYKFENGSRIVDAGASFGGVVKFQGEVVGDGTWSGGEVSVNVGSSNVNDFNPGTIAHFQRWSAGAAVNVTGMTRFQQAGQTHLLVNVGSNNITLKHEDAGSTAANRFLNSTGADIVLSQNQAVDVIYDATSQRWRAFKRN